MHSLRLLDNDEIDQLTAAVVALIREAALKLEPTLSSYELRSAILTVSTNVEYYLTDPENWPADANGDITCEECGEKHNTLPMTIDEELFFKQEPEHVEQPQEPRVNPIFTSARRGKYLQN